MRALTPGLAQGLDRPDRLLARLFTLRAEGLLDGLDPATARARLSGLLIGAELAAAKPYWLGQRVAVLGAGDLAALYARALDGLSVPVRPYRRGRNAGRAGRRPRGPYDGGTMREIIAILRGITPADALA